MYRQQDKRIRVCAQCIHFAPAKIFSGGDNEKYAACANTIHHVTGKPAKMCVDERSSWFGCGPTGRFWQAKWDEETPLCFTCQYYTGGQRNQIIDKPYCIAQAEIKPEWTELGKEYSVYINWPYRYPARYIKSCACYTKV